MHKTKGDLCRFQLPTNSIEKGSRFMSNSECIIEELGKRCYNKGGQTHDRSKLMSGRTASSAKANMQRLGPGRRAKHLEVQTMWVVEQDLSHLAVQVEYAGERDSFADKTRSKSTFEEQYSTRWQE